MDAGTPLIRATQRGDSSSSPAAVNDGAIRRNNRDRALDPDLTDVAVGLLPGYQSNLDGDADSDSRSQGASEANSSSSSSRSSRLVPRLVGMNVDSALSQSHHPLLSPSGGGEDSFSSGVRLHPLLSPIGSDYVLDLHMSGLDESAYLASRWSLAQPEDVFVHTFSFLAPAELASVSSVNKSWSHAAYEPSLWVHMDLSALYTRVDDAFIHHLLGSNRFVQLQFLSLEGCSAITNKSIKDILYFCPNLRELRVTDCAHITNPWVFVELVKALPYLRKLELFGATKEFAIVTSMLTARSKLDLGLFWKEYCAENGMKLDGKGLADCRYDEGVEHEDGPAPAAGGAGQRGCWGRVKGRIVYVNDFYHRGGNYPSEVLYSCQNHAEQDFADPRYQRCHVCENLFLNNEEGNSLWTPLICKVCFDQENLQNKNTWIPLDQASVKAFGISEVIAKTIHVASRKNLPVSLRTFGSLPARLDYNIPEPVDDDENDEKHSLFHRRQIDMSNVPLSTFVSVNGWRVDETVHSLRKSLTEAANALNTRALLVYDSEENIEVLADKRVILDGKEGEEHMQLIVSAWHQALEILYPIIIVMILAIHFSVLFNKQTVSTYDGTTNYSAYIRAPSDNGLSALLVVVIAVVGLVLLVIGIFLVYRFREQCERCFKRFLVADILLIFMFGVATLIWLLVAEWRIYLDVITFVGIIWNLSMIGLITLYYPMPERLHHFFLVLLNAIMSIMLVVTLGRWLVLTFLLIFAVGDILSELRPQMRWLSPFLIPTHIELIYQTPKILYTVGGLRLRAADLMCYGMLMGLALATGNSNSDYSSVLLGGSLVFISVMSSLSILLFVAPFIGCRFRPLPLAVITAFVLTMMEDAVLMPYLTVQN